MSTSPLDRSGASPSEDERPVSLGAGWAFHVAVFVVSAGYLAMAATTTDFGSLADPGPGFFPVIVGVVVVLGAILSGVRYARAATRTSEHREGDLPVPPVLRRPAVLILIFLGVAAVFLVTFDIVGYLISVAWFIAAMMLLAGDRTWLRIVITAVVAAAASDYLFVELLGVPLPYGVFGL